MQKIHKIIKDIPEDKKVKILNFKILIHKDQIYKIKNKQSCHN